MQTKLESFIETCVSILIGFIVSICVQLILFPLLGIYISFGQDVLITIIFTITSVIRGFYVRRGFNYWTMWKHGIVDGIPSSMKMIFRGVSWIVGLFGGRVGPQVTK